MKTNSAYTIEGDVIRTLQTTQGVHGEPCALRTAFSVVLKRRKSGGKTIYHRSTEWTASMNNSTLTVAQAVPRRETTIEPAQAATAYCAVAEELAEELVREIRAAYDQVQLVQEVIKPLEDEVYALNRRIIELTAEDPLDNLEPIPEPYHPEPKPRRPWWKVWGWAR